MENNQQNVVVVYGDNMENKNKKVKKEFTNLGDLGIRISEISGKTEKENIAVFNLNKEEMQLIVRLRMEVEKHKDTLHNIADANRREELRNLAVRFKTYAKSEYSYKTSLKSHTNLSWSQFDALIDSLVLFGFCTLDKNIVRFTIDKADFVENGIKRIQEILQNAEKEIELVSAAHDFDKDITRKVNLLKKKLIFDYGTVST